MIPPGAMADGRTRVFLAVTLGCHSVGEVADALGCTKSTAHDHLSRLRDDGLVTWEEGLNRTLRPVGTWLLRPVQEERWLSPTR